MAFTFAEILRCISQSQQQCRRYLLFCSQSKIANNSKSLGVFSDCSPPLISVPCSHAQHCGLLSLWQPLPGNKGLAFPRHDRKAAVIVSTRRDGALQRHLQEAFGRAVLQQLRPLKQPSHQGRNGCFFLLSSSAFINTLISLKRSKIRTTP